VTHPNRTIIAINITTPINRIVIANGDVFADGQFEGWHIRARNQSISSIPTSLSKRAFFPPVELGLRPYGIEKVDFVRNCKIIDTTITKTATSSTSSGSIVIALSRDQIPSNNNASLFPWGAIRLMSRKATTTNITTTTTGMAAGSTTIGNMPPPIQVLIPSTKFVFGWTINMSVPVDLDSDGIMDIVATIDGPNYNSSSSTNQSSYVGMLLWLRGDRYGNYTTIVLSDTLARKALFDIGDCDENGRLDIAVLQLTTRQLRVFYQESKRTFTSQLIGTK
jgi:hypothetical protein